MKNRRLRRQHLALRAWGTTVVLFTGLVALGAVAAPPTKLDSGPPVLGTGAPIDGVDLIGSIDPPGRLETLVASFLPAGSSFVEPGDADRVGSPISTVARLRQVLQRLGYDPLIHVLPTPGHTLRLRVELRPLDRLRQIFVAGNWPLRQDEIIRRISIRPGQTVPPAGPEREAALARERDRIVDYLRAQGYLQADVRLQAQAVGAPPARINLIAHVKLGAGYPLGDISVTGNAALTEETIGSHFRHQDWRWLWARPLPFRRSLLREDMTSLTLRYRHLGYLGARLPEPESTVDTSQKLVALHVTVRENKHVDVQFEGNDHRWASALLAELPLLSEGSYDDFAVATSAGAIAQKYRERGYMLARVTWRRQRVSSDSDRIVFAVNEGPQIKVREVQFAGAQVLPPDILTEAVTVRTFPLLGIIGLGEGGYATPLQLELDVERLVDLYKTNGYADVKVRCEFAPAPGAWQPVGPVDPDAPQWAHASALHVRFTIDEGPLVVVREIRFDPGAGFTLPRDEAFMRASLLSAVGAAYRPGLVREDVDRLKRLMGDEGHPNAGAEPLVTRTGPDVLIVWQLKQGSQVRLGPVFVRGNFLSHESTIRQWVPLEPGSLLTTTAFERGQRNLALIQLFNNASPISFPGEPAPDGTIPMLIEVEERHDHFGVVRLGGGASTEQLLPGGSFFKGDGLYASTGYEHRNLMGLGWRLLSKAEYGASLARAEANLLDPRFMGTLFRLDVGADYLRQATVRLGDIRSGAGTVGMSREMYPGVDASLRYSLRNRSRTEFLLTNAGPDQDQTFVRLGTIVGSMTAAVEWQRLDNPLLPTRGFKLAGSVELAHPALSLHAGDDTFVAVHGRSLAVMPLSRWGSLRHSVRYDQGFPLRGAALLPKVERFFAGGDTTIRGYELDRARTEIVRTATAPGLDAIAYHPLGGSLRILHNVDLQFPILRPWYGAVFLDSGLVGDSIDEFAPRRFRHGAGISPLLLRLPIGDISLSWAWPLDPQPGDARHGRLHFNVGLMF